MDQLMTRGDQAITRGSRLLALGGVAAVIFGVAALVWPGITALTLVILFGSFAIVSGVLTLVAGVDLATEHARHWVPMVFSGLGGIAIGAFTFFRPGITALALLYLIAVWAVFTGMLEFVAGVEFTGQVKGAWALWIGGLVSVAFGVYVALEPRTGALAIIWLIGAFAIVLGITQIVFAYEVYSDRQAVKTAARKLEPAAR